MHPAHAMRPGRRILIRRLVSIGPIGLANLLASPPARAQPTAPPPPIDAPAPTRSLTMSEALSYAHEHQPSIRAALARVAARAARSAVPSGQWLPTVGVTAQLFGMTANNTTGTYVQPDFMDIPRIGATPAKADGSMMPYASTLVGAGLLQEVFDFGRIGAQRAAADALVEAEKHDADAERLDVDFGVEEAFFSVFAAKAIVKASDDAYERARVHRDLAQAGVNSGLRSPIELTRAQADLARFDIGRVRARGGLAVAQSVLAAAIGAPDAAVDASPAAAGATAKSGEAPEPAEMPPLSRAVALAQARDPRLAAAISALRAAEEHTRAVGAELRPDLSLTATITGRAGGAQPNSGASGVPSGDGWIPSVPNWDVGVLLTWPLFDGVIAARRDAARSEEQVRREEIDVEREQEVARVRETYVAVQVARSTLSALDNAVVAARANYEQADARFRAGIGNAVELADAEAVRTDADIQLALGEFELARARAAFGRAIAEGL
ncbi:MAG TPA: TolC family protein [Polyangiaceae bacterium]|nr:TolC family protein [Polyangiaceae bacterium]